MFAIALIIRAVIMVFFNCAGMAKYARTNADVFFRTAFRSCCGWRISRSNVYGVKQRPLFITREIVSVGTVEDPFHGGRELAHNNFKIQQHSCAANWKNGLMDRHEFDKFAEEYATVNARNITVKGESPDYFAERDIYQQLRASGDLRDNFTILDFGSGVGSSVPFYKRYFPTSYIVCTDVSGRSLDLAKGRFGDLASYVLFDGGTLPLASGVFDIAVTVHHIPGRGAHSVAA